MTNTAHMLATTTDVAAARTAVAKLTAAQLAELADQLGIHLYGPVRQRRSLLVRFGVERRLDCAAIRGA